MEYNFAFLFDLDGVIIDTEPLYEVFWKNIGEKYHLGIENFECDVKGTTFPNVMKKYFSHFSPEHHANIEKEALEYEKEMKMDYIPGAYEFLKSVKDAGIKIALVTSSNEEKLKCVFKQIPIRSFFDTIVSADRVTEGKPNPMPFLQAAKDLGFQPENCIVFEDSFNGIKSGNSAGMKVVGLSTSNPKETIEENVYQVLPDFRKIASGETFSHFIKNILK